MPPLGVWAEVVARERKVGDALGHAARIFHIGNDADDFVGVLVVAEMLADGVVVAEEGAGGFLVEHQRQACTGGSEAPVRFRSAR